MGKWAETPFFVPKPSKSELMWPYVRLFHPFFCPLSSCKSGLLPTFSGHSPLFLLNFLFKAQTKVGKWPFFKTKVGRDFLHFLTRSVLQFLVFKVIRIARRQLIKVHLRHFVANRNHTINPGVFDHPSANQTGFYLTR